ncbi:hypothetical protein LX73_2386 [Fodinibius salinus]|uniref:Uncharacterized protein n=1 Tax=Fodinibius salinus TaxID=860790 RepID=A0A5D3YFE7_9BACT|nr:hypothetical protein [Fodinibius salinus]TYP92136.1 hypothetical protein LX73_2386 [Fodinibius salinus]
MADPIKYILLLTLLFVVGSAISQQNVAKLDNIGSSQSSSKTLCQQRTNGSISNPPREVDPLFEHASESHTNNTPPKTITSCNSSLHILPAESNFSFNPGNYQISTGFYNSSLSSQTFVFQEPDPPRLG